MREVSVGFKLAPIGTKLNSEGGEALKRLQSETETGNLN